MNHQLVSNVLQAVLEAALPLLASAAVVWLTGKCVELFKKLQDKNPELYEILSAISSKAVTAAEQVFGSGYGQAKKEYAINVVEKYLSAKGIDLDLDIIEAAIESEVNSMNGAQSFFDRMAANKASQQEVQEDDEQKTTAEDELPESANHHCENGVCSLN